MHIKQRRQYKMDAFVSGNAVVLPSGSFAANPNSWSLDWDSSGDNTRHQVSNLDTAPLSNDEAIPLDTRSTTLKTKRAVSPTSSSTGVVTEKGERRRDAAERHPPHFARAGLAAVFAARSAPT